MKQAVRFFMKSEIVEINRNAFIKNFNGDGLLKMTMEHVTQENTLPVRFNNSGGRDKEGGRVVDVQASTGFHT